MTDLADETEVEDLSIGASLAEAFDAFEADDAGPAAPAPADPAPTAQPARDEQGRFASKPADTPAETISLPEGSSGAGEPLGLAAPAIIGPPPAWSAAAKSEFAKLPPLIQQEVVRREEDMQRGKAQWQSGAERLNRLDGVLGPLQERLRINGVDESTFVAQLVAANDWLDRDAISGMLELGRLKGVDWRQLIGRLQGGQAPQQQLPQPLQQLMGQVQNLTAWQMQQVQAQQQAHVQAQQTQVQQHLTEIERFAADPANTYFENVRPEMADLIRAAQARGVTMTLADAYQRACWGNDQIRPLLQQSQDQQRQAEAAQARAAKVTRAQQASGSLTGSPMPGAAPGGGMPSDTLRGAIEDAYDAHA